MRAVCKFCITAVRYLARLTIYIPLKKLCNIWNEKNIIRKPMGNIVDWSWKHDQNYHKLYIIYSWVMASFSYYLINI